MLRAVRKHLLEIRARRLTAFNKLHGKQLIVLPGVRQTWIFFVMRA
ncbi:hypothetical protein SIAM614_29426 [Stappia aggregata IAM 12614]|uniref:Uncharacterized protein n=1 Tax=Roseibium aggregatum (strain ATCC 25650 / DSM 13394 / JCM 20685 / NBRC 16684 / NCIMB 2208 / IAM 12614 / B1) TaxID=384765 RepID=A0P1A5_ROSAI|nr:hypothetical protein SIAM614_29426 [Stappia aggregata IAM 12614] [Roseibium aggregatum IAM 12614]